MSVAFDRRVLAALATLATSGATVDRASVRRELGCTVAELRKSIQRLRYKGRIRLDSLVLNGPAPVIAAADALLPPNVAVRIKKEAAAASGRAVAARRRPAKLIAPLGALTMREQVATALVEEPGDLVATVKRQWPLVWEQVLVSARAEGVPPAAHLVAAIEAGLTKLDPIGRNNPATGTGS